MTTTQSVFQSALALTEKERAMLASELLASLPDHIDADDEQAFLSELERRADEAKGAPNSTVSWSEIVKK